MIRKVLPSMLTRIDKKEKITPGALVTHKQYGPEQSLGVVIEQREHMELADFGRTKIPVMRCTVCWVISPNAWT